MLHRLRHDIAWSFQQGRLHDLFLHDGITFATWGLVFATAALVIDSWLKGREQRARWKREDEQHSKAREEERARWLREDEIRLDQLCPKMAFGLDLKGRASGREPVELWCSNLGSVAVHVESVSIRRLSDLGASQVESEFLVHRLANAGEMIHIVIPPEFFRGLLFSVDIEVSCDFASAYKRVTTEGEVYSLFLADQGSVNRIRRGFHETRIVSCPTCGSSGYLNPRGIRSKLELQELIQTAEKEMAETCPDHSSTVLGSILNPQGVRTWSQESR